MKQFVVRNNTFIVTNDKVTALEVRKFLQDKIKEKSFVKGSVLKIYTGSHGHPDGKLSQRDDHKLIDGILAALMKLHQDQDTKQMMEEMGYEIGSPNYVGMSRGRKDLEADHEHVLARHGCQMAIARFLECVCLALWV